MSLSGRTRFTSVFFGAIFWLASLSALGAGAMDKVTESGIPLDKPWKVTIYDFAKAHLQHPAWGWSHSERDYRMALELAQAEKLKVDEDVLFAAAFLHDMGAIAPYALDSVDHALRSTQVGEDVLRKAGFPMEKFPAVKDAILGHMYNATPAKRAEAICLHDADTLDFMGTVGIARLLAITGNAPTFRGAISTIENGQSGLAFSLITKTARRLSLPRIAEMKHFLETLKAETSANKLI